MPKSLRPKEFPHFMERAGKNYRSAKPLGRIYSQVSLEEFTPAYDMPFDDRILTRFQLSTEELVDAKNLKVKYDVAMRRLMGQHERPISEFEVWSTFILSKPRVGTGYKMQETVGREVRDLKNRFRKICGETGEGTPQTSVVFSYSGVELQKLDRFVAAMYTVTHDEVQRALRERSTPKISAEGSKIADDQGADFPMPLISFPWLFHKELARVASGGTPTVIKRLGNHAYGGGSTGHTETGNGDAGTGLTGGYTNGGDQTMPSQITVREAQDQAQTEAKLKLKLEVNPEDEQRVLSKKEDASSDGQLDAVSKDQNGVRTASGKLVKRGEVLDLFDDDGKAIQNPETTISPTADLSKPTDEEPDMVDEEDDDEYNALDELARLIGDT